MDIEKQERISYIDAARAIAIFLVVLGHTYKAKAGGIRVAIYAFHVPLFFIISGMLLKRKNAEFAAKELLNVLKRRTYSYYVPYVIWGLFYSALSMNTLIEILYGTRETLMLAKSLSSLWFLPALLVASVISEIVLFSIKNLKRHNAGVIIFCFLFFVIGFILPHITPYGYPLGFDAGCVGAGFMLLGYLLKELVGFCYRNIGSCVVITIAAVLLFGIISHFMPPTIGMVAMYEGRYGNILIFMTNALLGSISVIGLAYFLDSRFTGNKLLNLIGKNTMGILVMHKPIVKYGRMLVKTWGLSKKDIRVALMVAIISVMISLFLTIIITKIAPVLFGKK